jgi:transcriptional regulator
MYTPRAFAESDLLELDRLLGQHPFVTLVSNDEHGLPYASHLPVLCTRDGERLLIEGHWARPNPQSRHDGPVLMIVHGPQAYISPAWYVDKEAAGRVPTWNYAVAHLYGRLRRSEDTAQLASLVTRLSRRFEREIGSDWEFEPGREDHVSQLRGIIAFEFEPERVELKFKLNQNHPVANVAAAADALSRLGGEEREQIATLMRDRLARRSSGA